MNGFQVLSICWIASIPAIYLAWSYQGFRRCEYTVAQSLLAFYNVILTRVQWRAQIPAAVPLRPGQGGVIIANHRSSIDPCFIQVAARRPVHWMVAAEFSSNPLIAWFYRFTQTIPTSRSGRDTRATKQAIRYAQQGEWVGMFPEGTVNASDQLLLKVRPGAILVALKAQVPVVPCYIDGSPYSPDPMGPLLMTAHVKVHFGQPIDLSRYYGREHDKEALGEATLECVKAIAVLAGRPDFEPQLAGRRWQHWQESESEPATETTPQES